jgi:hypothetical protein
MQALLGNVLDRIIADAGYRGHNAPAEHDLLRHLERRQMLRAMGMDGVF